MPIVNSPFCILSTNGAQMRLILEDARLHFMRRKIFSIMRARCWQYLVHGSNSPFPVLLMLWHIQTINMRSLIWGKEYKSNLATCCWFVLPTPSRVADAWAATGQWAHLDWVLDQSRQVQSSPSISCCGGGGGFGFKASGGILTRPEHTLSNSCGSITTIISALQSWGLKTTAYMYLGRCFDVWEWMGEYERVQGGGSPPTRLRNVAPGRRQGEASPPTRSKTDFCQKYIYSVR